METLGLEKTRLGMAEKVVGSAFLSALALAAALLAPALGLVGSRNKRSIEGRRNRLVRRPLIPKKLKPGALQLSENERLSGPPDAFLLP